MRFIKYDAHLCLKPCILWCALNLFFFQSTMAHPKELSDELSAVTQAEGKLKVDPSIGISDMQAMLEAYMKAEGCRNFQKLLDMIVKEGTTWTSRPKVCLL